MGRGGHWKGEGERGKGGKGKGKGKQPIRLLGFWGLKSRLGKGEARRTALWMNLNWRIKLSGSSQ